VLLSVDRPKAKSYPTRLKTVGDHLRKHRLDRGLFQRQVAEMLGVDTTSVYLWETGRAEPAIRQMPGIIRFLGYDPVEAPETFAERLKAARRLLGISQRKLAARLGVDPSTVWRWERWGRDPPVRLKKRVEQLLKRFGLAEVGRSEARGYSSSKY
jgi:transcriptional regulator with XRE-family HTH domain